MERVKTYKTNRFLALVITVMGFALIFTMGIDRLFVFYKDPWGVLFVSFFGLINPLLFLFGFSCQIRSDEIVSISYLLLKKRLKINDLSHVLYQPTWRGVTPVNSQTNMRSLYIVRHTGGWNDTISLANGAYREENLADIARRLSQMNPGIELDEHAEALMKKYS